jgi:hypothetical protein
MPAEIELSKEALALLRLHAEQQGGIPVDDTTREPYRELAREGLMIVGHSFTGGRESFYALTEMGKKLACVLERMPTAPLPGISASPRRWVRLGAA